MSPPDKLRIIYNPYEEGRFHYVGKLRDGKQFMAFVTGAFPGTDRYPDTTTDDWRSVKQWLAVIHKFDEEGNYISSEARRGGFEIEGREVATDRAWTEFDRMLEHEDAEFCDIYVKPFEAEIEGISYELVYEHHYR